MTGGIHAMTDQFVRRGHRALFFLPQSGIRCRAIASYTALLPFIGLQLAMPAAILLFPQISLWMIR